MFSSPPTCSIPKHPLCLWRAALQQALIHHGYLNTRPMLASSSEYQQFFALRTSAKVIHPSAVNETPTGALQSFTINADGTLSTPQDTVSTEGDSPAFAAALSTGEVGVMNYNTGNGRFIPTTGSPSTFDKDAPTISFPRPPGAVSHPHMALEYGDEVFVPDLVGLFRLYTT